ncbi:ADP-ribosylglycohydrolase family protein [Deinococcus sp. QL22]|uniref:ADP-ribosylglycohydrolase family protein n=1 Tax=Deinococcus sp. QL22 TaxID=2939437 RepID=UPI002017A3E7|nr:ADP-ribosylglycohydrolase family protein [Deinococcus sp. QL22]UQN05156.1 ADP-ribosylglycohydrolase family protein [Deinococcus sp. QL22]
MTSSPPTRQARLKTLLSLSAADALGAATEFKTPEAIRSHYGDTFNDYQPGSVFGFAPGEATDDSQMVAATLLGYSKQNGLEGVLAGLQDWIATGPPDVGNLTRDALHRGGLHGGGLDGGARAWASSNFQSAGNGGLMRIAAVWIAGCTEEALAHESALVTALTHADPRCVHASVFFTAFLDALHGGTEYTDAAELGLKVMDSLDARAVLLERDIFTVNGRDANTTFHAQDRDARTQVRARVRDGLAGKIHSQSGYVLDTLQAAVAHARAETWQACVEPAVLLGNDSDTVACVVGAVAGARGLEVPPHLLPPLRLGHSWAGWQRDWKCVERFGELVR